MEKFILNFLFIPVGEAPYPLDTTLLLCDKPNGRLAFGFLMPDGELCIVGGQWQPTHFCVAQNLEPLPA